MAYKQFAFSCKQELYDTLKERATAKHMSMSKYVNELIEMGLRQDTIITDKLQQDLEEAFQAYADSLSKSFEKLK